MWPRIDGMRTMEIGDPYGIRPRLNELILSGAKRATVGLLAEYIEEDEALEHVGERLVLVDDEGDRLAILEVDLVAHHRFGAIPWEVVAAENEGHATIDEWKAGHLRFWTGQGVDVHDDTDLVAIFFHLVDRGVDPGLS